MSVTNNLASLNITLDELYREVKQINIKLSDSPHEFHVVLVDRIGRADCKISSWTANLWGRTNKALKFEKYTSLSSLQSAIVRLIKSKVETNGDITFSLTDDVHIL